MSQISPSRPPAPYLQEVQSEASEPDAGAPEVQASPAESHYTLSIRWEEDCLLMSLNQEDQLVCVGVLESFSSQLVRFQELSRSGRALFEHLLPKRIQSFFQSAPSALLTLRLDTRLAEIPWESACVHETLLSDLHKISRTSLTPLPTPAQTQQMHSPLESRAGERTGPAGPERALRQLTVLSYDLVGSTQMMRELGVEKYSLLLDQTHMKFASVIHRWGGQSDPPMGDDGIMCYFGLPLARPGAPQRALSAALELIQEAQTLGVRIRVGVATGMVAVDASHKVGPSIHLAARLQCLTDPGTVSVCAETRHLTRHRFAWGEEYTLAHLRGFEQEIRVAHLLQSSPPQNPDGWTNLSRWPLVGRTRELEWLRYQWRQATVNRGRMVQIEGEAGIGKSKLVRAFAKERQAENTRVLVCRCSPDTMTRPFAPFVQLLERLFHVDEHLYPSLKDPQDVQAFAQTNWPGASQQLSRLLMGLSNFSSQGQTVLTRKELLGLMVNLVLAHSDKLPLLLLVKDVQWADPSTLAFLEQLALSLSRTNLLVVVTRRIGGITPPHKTLPFNEVLRMQALSAQEAKALVQLVKGEQPMTADAVQVVLDKAQGIPLFLEELTRYLLSQPQNDLNTLSLPATVQDVLLQRLDHLGANKRVAQLCSVLGREISWPLMLQLWKRLHLTADVDDHNPELSLQSGLEALQASGLIARKKTRGDPVYFFRHAMIEDAAYHSMWQLDRSQLHRLVANLLEESFPRICHEHPALLAHHWALAEAYDQALRWSLKAARKYKKAETHLEALTQLQTARQWLEQLPDSAQKQQHFLEIELQTAGELIETKGYGEAQVEHTFRQAMRLALQLNDKKALLRAQLGMQAYYLVRGEFGQAHTYIALVLETAQAFHDALTQAKCEWALACIRFHQGDLVKALEKIDACIASCERHGAGHDVAQSPEVNARMYGGICALLLGNPDEALDRGLAAVRLAERMEHRVSLGQALGVLSMVHWGRQSYQDVQTTSLRALSVLEDRDHELWRAHAHFMQGLAMAALAHPTDAQEGLAQMARAQSLWSRTGAKLNLTYFQTLRAQMLGRCGRQQEALDLIEQTLSLVQSHGEAYFEAEMWRVKGELLLQSPATARRSSGAILQPVLEQAHACFSKSLQLARARQMRTIELRCLCSAIFQPLTPTQHLQLKGELRLCLDHFSQSEETGDLLRARQMLQ
jgi:class 3 adenylate cyclase/tetratricopeptide (TPR) repeat protein